MSGASVEGLPPGRINFLIPEKEVAKGRILAAIEGDGLRGEVKLVGRDGNGVCR